MSSLLLLAARAKSFDDCTKVTPDCPVDATVLGYVPNLGSSIFFAIAFGLLCVASLGVGLWKRTWTYCAAVTVGVFLECIGKDRWPLTDSLVPPHRCSEQ